MTLAWGWLVRTDRRLACKRCNARRGHFRTPPRHCLAADPQRVLCAAWPTRYLRHSRKPVVCAYAAAVVRPAHRCCRRFHAPPCRLPARHRHCRRHRQRLGANLADDAGHHRQAVRGCRCEQRLHQARGDDSDARWGQAAHGDRAAEGRQERADRADAHALRCQWPHRTAGLAAYEGPAVCRRRRLRGRRLHPCVSGRARQIRFRGRLRDDAPAAWAAQFQRGRPCHRCLGHHRLAGEERQGIQWQGRHDRFVLRRIHRGDGADQPASRLEGGGAGKPDDRRLDGRRLVQLRRFPPGQFRLLHRPAQQARQGRRHRAPGARRLQQFPAGRLGRRLRQGCRPGAVAVVAQAHRTRRL